MFNHPACFISIAFVHVWTHLRVLLLISDIVLKKVLKYSSLCHVNHQV